jgi:small-conductance mechanosensitive channel
MLTLLIIALTALTWLLEITVTPEAGVRGAALYYVALALTAVSAVRVVETFFAAMVHGGGKSQATSDRLRAMTTILLYLTAGLLWLRLGLGVDVSSLIATSAVFSVIIGFALQPTLGNLFSGVALELERPLQVGDHILKGQVEGRVEALKWRSLFIRTERDTCIVLPNSALTGEAVEVIRRGEPSRHMIVFSIPATVPPMEVLAVMMQVLTSGLPDICRDPAPSALLLGTESHTGCLRYGARYYTLAYLKRLVIGSSLYVRLWYSLSRQGIAMSPASALLLTEDGDQMASQLLPAPTTEAAKAVPLPVLPEGFAGRLQSLGRRLRYGPGEPIDLQGGAAVVLSGSAREEVRGAEQDVSLALARMLDAPLDTDAPPIISARLLTEIAARAATFIGPIAHTLAARYGVLTDDPFLLYRALGEHIADARERARFLLASPDYPSRRLNAGALFGWASVLGLEAPGLRHPVSNNSVEILLLTPAEVRSALSGFDPGAGVLAGAEPGLRGLTAEALRDWLACAEIA